MSDLSFLSVYGKNWIDDYLEKEFHGASKFWNKETARQFASVDIETLLFDEYFLNGKSWIYPGIADVIFEIHEEMKKRPIHLIAVAGGIGTGKTSGVLAIMNWLSWYKFTCKFKEDSQMVCPQEFYGLKPTSKVAFIALSKTLDKSKQITFSEMKSAFVSQFNKDYFPINERKKSQIEIEANNTVVFPNTATEASNAGWSIYSFCMDEISFLDIIDSSSRSRGQAEDVYDQAQAAYNSAYGRMFSRFGGDGLGVITSSVNFDEDFLMKKMRQIYTGTAVEPSADSCYMKIIIPWEINAAKWNKSKKFFYFDTENYKIIKEKKEVIALNKYFIESRLEDIVFGNTDNDPNDQLLKDVRTGKITVEGEKDE